MVYHVYAYLRKKSGVRNTMHRIATIKDDKESATKLANEASLHYPSGWRFKIVSANR